MLYGKVNIYKTILVCWVAIPALFYSCSNTKYLADDKSLLIKNKIVCKAKDIKSEDLEALLKQKENQKSLFFFRFNAYVYNACSKGKARALKKWLKEHVGSEPVVYDELLAEKTQDQLTRFLNNKGYFLAQVDKKIKTRRKKTKLVYKIEHNRPYKLNEVEYKCDDSVILKQLVSRNKFSFLVKGENFDIQNLENERERIVSILQHKGYYFFDKEYIVFEADSALNSFKINLTVTINNPIARDSTAGSLYHKKYMIDNTYFIIDYDYKEVLRNKAAFFENLDTMKIQDKVFMLYKGKPYVKPQVILNCNYIKNNELYNVSDVEKTRLYLSQNGIFRQISVEFEVSEKNVASDSIGLMDCYVQISPAVKQSYSVNLEGTNTGGDWGAQIKATYENKNIFNGAETFNSKIHFSYEQNSWLKTEAMSNFNSRDYGVDLSVVSPKFIVPFKVSSITKRYGLRTFVKIGYNYQRIPSYERPLRYLSFGYISKNNKNLTQYFTPLEVNGVQYINKTKTFNDYILEHNIAKNFEDYYISSTNYTLYWQSKSAEKLQDYSSFKYSVDLTGNTLYLYSVLTKREKIDGSYRMFDTKFAQYIKQDVEIKHYLVQDVENATVFRLFAGFAIPYGNNNVVPNIKQYFAGGSNSMRAWQSLGPGSYRDTKSVYLTYSMSDVKLEANVEQRFAIFSFLNGALFTDIGNIWSVHKMEGEEGTTFGSGFYKQLAVATGFGLRPNFSFFVLRLDFAVKLRDPSYQDSEQWLWLQRKSRWTGDYPDYNLTIGIGYPF